MISSHETFGGTWPFAPRFFDGNGFRMHYVEEGSGQPIICLHGEPTWGYLYRRFIPPLSQSHRVIVPDHMGFGKSGTPRDRPYTAATRVTLRPHDPATGEEITGMALFTHCAPQAKLRWWQSRVRSSGSGPAISTRVPTGTVIRRRWQQLRCGRGRLVRSGRRAAGFCAIGTTAPCR
jgi:alpha/beta hydrolase fold